MSAHNGSQAPSDELPDEMDSPESEQTRMEYIKSIVPPSKPKRKWPILVIGLTVIIGCIVATGFVYLRYHKSGATPEHKSTSQKSIAPKSGITVNTITHYVSNGSDLNLTFDYPSNWTVSPASGNNQSDQAITLNSPLESVMNSSGNTVLGKTVVSIRPGSAVMTELGANATAGLASVQFGYSNPTASQYQYPYLTFINLPGGPDADSDFQEILISGTMQFSQSQSITAASVAADPIITASFYSCSTAACTGNGAVPLSITYNTWQQASEFKQTLKLFESLQLN